MIAKNLIRTSLVLLTLTIAAWPATDPAGFHIWKSSQIGAEGKTLAAKVNASKVASDVLATDGNRMFEIVHREGTGQAEWHEKEADIMIIHSGAGTLVYGGEMVGGKTTAPGQIRGTSIKGGTEVALGPGDVLQIPAKTPHWVKVAPGKTITYFVAKVIE